MDAPRTAAQFAGRGQPAAIDAERLRRLRWRCRRGMLENDLVLSRFLDARGADLREDEVASLDRLLDMADNDLWNLIAGRMDPQDPAIAAFLPHLRAA